MGKGGRFESCSGITGECWNPGLKPKTKLVANQGIYRNYSKATWDWNRTHFSHPNVRLWSLEVRVKTLVETRTQRSGFELWMAWSINISETCLTREHGQQTHWKSTSFVKVPYKLGSRFCQDESYKLVCNVKNMASGRAVGPSPCLVLSMAHPLRRQTVRSPCRRQTRGIHKQEVKVEATFSRSANFLLKWFGSRKGILCFVRKPICKLKGLKVFISQRNAFNQPQKYRVERSCLHELLPYLLHPRFLEVHWIIYANTRAYLRT